MNAEPKIIQKKTTASSALGWFAGIVLGAAVIGVSAVVFFFNPSTHGFYPTCRFHQLTGWNCAGCGMTRALYALMHGNVTTAMHDNALFVALLATVAVRSAWFGAKKLLRQPTGKFVPLKIFWPLLVAAFVFTVLRNLPAFSFLSP
jgi:hypothetical protein